MKIQRFTSILILLIMSISMAKADIIPDANIEGNWNTLLTDNNYYFYAIREDGKIKLGQTTIAPKTDAQATGGNAQYHYSNYCFQIEGNETDGYTFRCLAFEKDLDGPKYISNPTVIDNAYQEVLITTTPSHYFFTSNRQLQLMNERTKQPLNHYLAFYSRNWHTVRLHNSPNYEGSRLIIGGIYSYNVSTVIDGTTNPVPGGGVTYNGVKYINGETLRAGMNTAQSAFTAVNVEGYQTATKTVTAATPTTPGSIVVTYNPIHGQGYRYEHVSKPVSGNIYNGIGDENSHEKQIALLDPKEYITNIDKNGNPKYTKVPAGKAWQMIMEVENSGMKSFNQWGSCILSSSADPLNTYYWGDFQVYQHKYTEARPATLNFKSNKGDGMDHVIAQNHSVQDQNYKVTIRYDGGNIYVIRTTIGDVNYDNVWYAARVQQDITQMSCALPEGINLKSLSISIAEEHGLFEDVDYAIQNLGNGDYLSWDLATQQMQAYHHADHASKFRVVFTNDPNLAYHDGDGALHSTIHLKVEVFNEQTHGIEYKFIGNGGTLVDDKKDAMPFLFSPDSKHICQVINTGSGAGMVSELGKAWTLADNAGGACAGGNDQWWFDFFASYQVVVNRSELQSSSNRGGIRYKTLPYYHDQFIELPGNVDYGHWNNISVPGYSTSVMKAATMVKVDYTPLDDTFYTFTKLGKHGESTSQKLLHYWQKDEQKLIFYNNGVDSTSLWSDKGDVSQYSIAQATSIPVTLNQNTKGDNPDRFYYGTIYSPAPLVMPEGMKAYTAEENATSLHMTLAAEPGEILPRRTAAILVHESKGGTYDIAINNSDNTSPITPNAMEGIFETIANPNLSSTPDATYYTLSGKSGIGFYKYTGTSLNAFKAFYKTTSANARFSFVFDDETAISLPTEEDRPTDGKYMERGRIIIVKNGIKYNLNGTKE